MRKYAKLVSLLVVAVLAIYAFAPAAAQQTNPFRPVEIFEMVDVLAAAVAGKGDPGATPMAVLTNAIAPFWTAAAIGSQRAASELGAPVVFQSPARQGDIAGQVSILETLINDQYKGIAFSAIDPNAVIEVIKKGIDAGVPIITMDSDAAPGSGRYLYLGLNNYNAGLAAGKEMVKALGEKGGKVVAFVGFLTAQNAIDRIEGIKKAFEGTNVTLETVLVDNVDPSKALSNAETAITTYPDLAGMMGIYSYNGPAIAQAIKTAGKVGQIKLVAFDLEPGTINALKEGIVTAAIGQRVYFYGYLSVYILYAMATLGPAETMKLLDKYLLPSDPSKADSPKDIIDTGADIVTPETLGLYQEYLDSIGIKSQ